MIYINTKFINKNYLFHYKEYFIFRLNNSEYDFVMRHAYIKDKEDKPVDC